MAQVNLGRLRAAVDDPLIADFVAGLDRINVLADSAPGFVWRLQTEDGNATAIRPVDDDELLAINLSVWESVEALADFVYRSHHVAFHASAPRMVRAVRLVIPGPRVDTGGNDPDRARGHGADRSARS